MRNLNFVEVWIDPMLSPPYLLLLLSAPSGHCCVHDPAKGYKIVFQSETYDQAQTWLLEDEDEPVEGRLSAQICNVERLLCKRLNPLQS
jgi:hypothetical protein